MKLGLRIVCKSGKLDDFLDAIELWAKDMRQNPQSNFYGEYHLRKGRNPVQLDFEFVNSNLIFGKDGKAKVVMPKFSRK